MLEFGCEAGPDEAAGVSEAKKAASMLLRVLRDMLRSKFASEAIEESVTMTKRKQVANKAD